MLPVAAKATIVNNIANRNRLRRDMTGIPHSNELCLITGYNLLAFIVAAIIVPGMTRIAGNRAGPGEAPMLNQGTGDQKR